MSYDLLSRAATDHPWHALAAALALLAVLTLAALLAARAFSVPVTVAAAGALVCTTYSADTSWRFAEHSLGMTDSRERLVMFAAAELALLACAVMARANKHATTTASAAGRAGTPGVLVWGVTGVQVIPAYSESGIVGGTVRAIIGPVMAGLLWHLAMGLEIRVTRPGALSTGLPAMVGRELRERLLSYLGLATRDRTAEQITRDRATARAVRLASRRLHTPWGRHRLAAAVARSGAADDPAQHDRLMHQLAARRTAGQLATITIASPWRAPTEYGTTVERVPVPEDTPPVPAVPVQARPALPAPPPAVPAGARLLPVVCRRAVKSAPYEEFREGAAALGAFPAVPPRTRPEVHVRYVPEVPEYPQPAVPGPGVPEAEEEVPAGDLDVPDPDPLIEKARDDFPDGTPGVATLKKTYGIGQARAQRVRDALKVLA
ncbi:hypothetical protein [Streptomyces odonnellii]|uniref:hypothetical protein n=1 Tax=Streptomyces odonnellii TaxID=1417980 RepID=UPI000695D6B0|nr:hypothetical protein [Streptomyces odonnellii]